jgi:DOMON domain/Eukaryotic cytochrome b561
MAPRPVHAPRPQSPWQLPLARAALVLALAGAAAAAANESSTACSVAFKGATLQYQGCRLDLSAGMRVYWNLSDSEIDTLFSGNPKKGGWIGFGWGRDKMVGANAAVAFLNSSGTADVYDYYLADKSSAACVVANKQGISKKEAEVLPDGTILARFVRPRDTNIQNSSTYAIWANGPGVSGGTTLKEHSGSSYATGLINLATTSATGNETVQVSAISTALKVHGVLMAVAWLLLAPLGIFFMRHLKKFNPVAFQVHRGLMVTAFVVAVVSFIIGVIKKTSERGLLSLHLGLGVVAGVLAILQIIGGIFRPQKATRRRPLFNLLHGWSGRIAVVLAVIDIFIGLKLAKAKALLYILTAAVVALWTALFVVFSVFLRKPFPIKEPEVVSPAEHA